MTRVRSPWPPERAFAYMADLRNFAEWDPGVKASRQVEGKQFVATAESSTLTSVDTVSVVAEGDGSIVTYDAELTLNGILSLGDIFLRLAFRRIGDRAAAGMRKALEGEDAG